MIMVSHQIFTVQLQHLIGQIKFDQTNLFNAETNQFKTGKQNVRTVFSPIINTV